MRFFFGQGRQKGGGFSGESRGNSAIFELQILHGTSYGLSQQIMRFFFGQGRQKGRSQGRQGVTQPYFELQTPDFAWKFVWIVLTNYEIFLVRGARRGGVLRGIKG